MGLGEEDVLGFEVSVEDFSVVELLDGEADLCEVVENLLFVEVG